MRTLLTLPTETKLTVVSYVDDKDLLTLNSTCRAMHQLLPEVIASTFAADRTYQFSIPRMTDLLRLSMDNFDPRFLKTLILLHPGRQAPPSCYNLLHKALQNLGSFGKLQSIGVRHADDGVNFESNKQQAHRCIKLFLEETLLKWALEAKLPINNIIFEVGIGQDVFFSGVNRRGWFQSFRATRKFTTEVTEIMNTMRALRSASFPEAKHTFRLVREGFEGTRHSTAVTYDHQAESLHGFRLLVDDWLLLQRWFTSPGMLRTITLTNCDIEYPTLLHLAISPLLESLTIKNARLYRISTPAPTWAFTMIRRPFFDRPWEEVLDALRIRCHALAHCRLGHLRFNDGSMFTGPTWEARNIDDVNELLHQLCTRRRSRMVYKKENAPSTGPRKPRKKAPKTKKTRFTHKKRKATLCLPAMLCARPSYRSTISPSNHSYTDPSLGINPFSKPSDNHERSFLCFDAAYL
ncbi:hypothetical protein KCU65_g393, partial [Aureobasidium melanogenum]